ncbi:hypothetical protein GCM10023083_43960 [Streptomyces phyllanthi]
MNVRAPFLLIDGGMELLRQTAPARIVAVSSVTGQAPEPGLAAYRASKAALTALCEAVNTETSADGVTAAAICLGYVDTDMSAWNHDRVPPAERRGSRALSSWAAGASRSGARPTAPSLMRSGLSATDWTSLTYCRTAVAGCAVRCLGGGPAWGHAAVGR